MDIASEVRASYAFVARNFNLVKRYLSWEVVFIVFTLVNVLTIGFIGVATGDKRMVLYLVIGALVWRFLSVIFHEVSESIQWERWEGTIEYTFMAPIRRTMMLFGTVIYAVLYGTINTGITLIVALLFFDLTLSGANILTGLLVLIISSFSFIGLGILAAILPLMSTERGSQAAHIIQAIVLLVSGVYYPISVLPEWIRPLSVLSPATYTLRMMRDALLNGRSIGEMWFDILILGIVGFALIPLAIFFFNLAERHAKKLGKLKRSG
ncbi:MAG: ABC transporter permease [Candidatus Coatesbacteria bacterium]|nr:MAG: ABC transporter permease [Candidatus Coatesbacteria bacterium]